MTQPKNMAELLEQIGNDPETKNWKVISGRELYNTAMNKATKWNNGTIPSIGIRQDFLATEIISEEVVCVIVRDKKEERIERFAQQNKEI